MHLPSNSTGGFQLFFLERIIKWRKCHYPSPAGKLVLTLLGWASTCMTFRKAGRPAFLCAQGTKKAACFANGLCHCDPAGARTQDPYIKSVLLYQLSYRVSHFLRGANICSQIFISNGFEIKIWKDVLSRIVPEVEGSTSHLSYVKRIQVVDVHHLLTCLRVISNQWISASCAQLQIPRGVKWLTRHIGMDQYVIIRHDRLVHKGKFGVGSFGKLVILPDFIRISVGFAPLHYPGFGFSIGQKCLSTICGTCVPPLDVERPFHETNFLVIHFPRYLRIQWVSLLPEFVNKPL